MIAQEFLSNIAQQSLLSNTLLSNDFPIIARSLLSNVAQQLLPGEMDVEEIKSPGKAVDLNDKQKSILAEVVKKRSAIWDAKDPDYKKKAVENWMDVADEFEQRSGSKNPRESPSQLRVNAELIRQLGKMVCYLLISPHPRLPLTIFYIATMG
uniref:MADF domain-containing protein n=1 Tax=Ditylenchus dipsaci TaxID=166011 RepID=A0A915DAP9_9BILA